MSPSRIALLMPVALSVILAGAPAERAPTLSGIGILVVLETDIIHDGVGLYRERPLLGMHLFRKCSCRLHIAIML
jgi:hypothetical protein